MTLFKVVFGRITEHSFMVAALTADRAIDVALVQLRRKEPNFLYTRDDLLQVTMESLVIVDTCIA